MKKSRVLRHFRGVVNTAKAFGVSHQAVSQWPDIVPERIALKAEKLSGGKLKVNPKLYL